ncbi:MAG: hypothetical protein Q7S27_04810 [Nanoarchaeota archaeon]|nr:hypothetical protein [Nanoarchaeota archaeon]
MVKKEGGKSLKTFNLNGEIYREYSEYCRKHGISMSKKVENFIKQELEKFRGVRGDENKTIERKSGEFSGEIEHSFKKYC